ncbi:RecX family transcriptional regulator [Sphingomonas sp. Leaf412]|uniref:regulatory protein RecX n=1 Tax=Sphingomonas sp. Leaf412 TaxID=1736370 RepID=UPI0006F7128E|nr:RecX family transcriptional regulator [Sphingomonas sp. Leaf412]KQT33783.1 RecX family transcriptional regulator [Sphingomonas sp. Leaf412]
MTRRDRPPPPPPPPLDAVALDRLALRYVERFATTRGKLADYLYRKVRERGWAGDRPADPAAVADRMAALGYVDDRGYAVMKGAALGRRGYGARRVADVLRVAGVTPDDAGPALHDAREEAWGRALELARRKRIGAFAAEPADARLRARQLAQMLRAGHDLSIARRLIDAAPGEVPEIE